MTTSMKWKLRGLAVGLPLSAAIGLGTAWSAGERVGSVIVVEPAATVTEAGKQPAIVKVNSDVSMADIVRTDVNGFVKIEFKDGSQLTVNPGSNVTIDQYVYDSSTNAGTLVMSVGSGVARFVSGKMKKEDIKIKTTTATMGLRGTDIIIRSDGTNTQVEVLSGSISVVPCDTKDQVYTAGRGQVIGVDWSCAVRYEGSGQVGVSAGDNSPSGSSASGSSSGGSSSGSSSSGGSNGSSGSSSGSSSGGSTSASSSGSTSASSGGSTSGSSGGASSASSASSAGSSSGGANSGGAASSGSSSSGSSNSSAGGSTSGSSGGASSSSSASSAGSSSGGAASGGAASSGSSSSGGGSSGNASSGR